MQRWRVACQWLVARGDYCRCCCFSVLELAVAASKTDPPDVLDRQKCLDALAEQRRSKWFQVCSFRASLFSLGHPTNAVVQSEMKKNCSLFGFC